MKISSRSYYGLRALTYLAKKKGVLAVRTIAREEKLPYDYLEKIFQRLKTAGLVRSAKGAEGGYSLAFSPRQTKVGKIIEILEGRMVSAPCLTDQAASCTQAKGCLSRSFWGRMEKVIYQSLNSVSLADLLKS